MGLLPPSFHSLRRRAALALVAPALLAPLPARAETLVLPAAAPAIFSGLRIAQIIARAATIGAGYVITAGHGIGAYLIGARQFARGEDVLAATLAIGLIAFLVAAP